MENSYIVNLSTLAWNFKHYTYRWVTSSMSSNSKYGSLLSNSAISSIYSFESIPWDLFKES